MKKILLPVAYGAIGLATLAGLLVFIVLPLLQRATYGDWNKIYAKLQEDGATRALVHGHTDTPLAGWTTSLVWNKGNDKWFVYYLNHDAYFEKYELRDRDCCIDVFCNETLLGTLQKNTAEFLHQRQHYLYKEPMEVIHGTNLEDREKWSYWTQPNGQFAHE